MNFKSESIMPKKWAYGHSDWKYIKNVHKRFGTSSLKNYPYFAPLKIFYWTIIQFD